MDRRHTLRVLVRRGSKVNRSRTPVAHILENLAWGLLSSLGYALASPEYRIFVVRAYSPARPILRCGCTGRCNSDLVFWLSTFPAFAKQSLDRSANYRRNALRSLILQT